ncbi:hypothetical protein M9H77_06467 [Catharanthus roseus]|uniref:Uncharacterized protein n=1 Tax=Catharanthus roseus TaxID=4058 RepID=A0ACC0BS64_CATRO|nr:hypothetical protein M9H77_06467 [Catharanthus roseus]
MLCDKGEVLLSAGALGSPQLLLLSGIRPSAYLCSWGIPVAHHHPYVGITNSRAYLEAASNVIPFSAPSHGAFVRSSPSLVYFIVATLMEKIVGPLSAGYLRIASTHVKVNPIVKFNYFRNPGDVERNFRVFGVDALKVVDDSTFTVTGHQSAGYSVDAWSKPVSLVQKVSLELCLTLENQLLLEMKTTCKYIEEYGNSSWCLKPCVSLEAKNRRGFLDIKVSRPTTGFWAGTR